MSWRLSRLWSLSILNDVFGWKGHVDWWWNKTFAGFEGVDFKFCWIREILPKCRFLVSSGAECGCGAHFWPLPCLDELASKSVVKFVNFGWCVCLARSCWLMMKQNFRWIWRCWFQVSLDSRNSSIMQAFGFFWGSMSSWRPFRCTCLDALESKSDVRTYVFPGCGFGLDLIMWHACSQLYRCSNHRCRDSYLPYDHLRRSAVLKHGVLFQGRLFFEGRTSGWVVRDPAT